MQNRLKDGTYAPGATTICNLLNKPYLVKWANKMGLKGINTDEYVNEAASIGKIIHSMCESHLTGEGVDLSAYTEEQIEKAYEAFKKFLVWKEQHEIESIFCEKEFLSENYRFCGIVDWYAKIDGKWTIADFKTSKGISKEYFLQLSSYIILLLEEGYPVDQIMVINIGRDDTERFEVAAIDLDAANTYFDMFNSLLHVYWIKKQLDWK